jgi:Mrp family chromosome partitioning ATPase
LPGLERFPDRFWRSVLRITAGIHTAVRPTESPESATMIVFTGAAVGVGTTTLALATALQLVRDPGVSVLLVDAQATESGEGDLPARAEGLIQLALGQVRLERAIVPTDHPGLGYLPRGGGSYNGPKLIERVIPMLGELRTRFDHVILDTAPVVVAPEAARLASVADGTVVVMAAERTPKTEARRVREVLDEYRAPLLGSVINRARRIAFLAP